MSALITTSQWRAPGPPSSFSHRSRFISAHTATRLRWSARLWGTGLTAAFLVMALRGGVPRSPSPGDWEIYAQLAVLIGIALGGIATWRWEGLGASIITAGAIGLGVFSAIEHSPYRALLVTLAFYIPGLLFWLDWQRTKPAAEVALLAACLALALGVGGWQANRVYSSYFGPVQPASSARLQPSDHVDWVWSGATTTDSIAVKAQLVETNAPVRLAVSLHPAMTSPVIVKPDTIFDNGNGQVASFAVGGLTPDTPYWYAIEIDGQLELARQGRFRTFPSGPSSFTFAFSSCASTGSNGAVFDTIREADPLFFLSAGDFFYANIDTNDPSRFWNAYQANLTAPGEAALYQQTSIAYVWDDHDFGPNDADATSPSRAAAHQVYRQAVPHYELAAGDEAPIYQAFTVGRVRFILTDGRSARTPESALDDAAKTMLGSDQKAWFKRELLAARDLFPVIIWVNTVPWIAAAQPGADGWGAYATERQELADFIAANKIHNVIMLGGDAHMLGIDDGSNSDYSRSGVGGFPVFHAGALDRHGSLKGGPYSEGAFPGGGQFGLVSIADEGGDTITITMSGRTYKGDEIVGYQLTVPLIEPAAPAISATVDHGHRVAVNLLPVLA